MSDTILPGANYLLPKDEKERERLHTQHKYMLRTVYEDRLIFDKSVNLPVDGYILDAGTGSGSWLMDLAIVQQPEAHLYGVDVSTSLFPTVHPPNVTFTQCSITALPDQWTERFDFINQRLMMSALRIPEWPIVIAEVFRVLKPGGSVQFAEARVKWDDATATSKTLLYLLQSLYSKQEFYHEPAAQIPELLKQAGFVDIRFEEKSVIVGKGAGELGIAGKDALGGAYRGMVDVVMRHGGLGFVQSAQEYGALMDAWEADWDRGITNRFEYGLVVAQKPLK